jgi:uncharacterized protein YqeY
MTLEKLQQEMIAAMKAGDKFRKTVISTTIAQIKKAAIDKGCRDNIPESLVDEVLLKTKKITQEMLDTCPESRQDLLEDYKKQMDIICEFAPQLITDENEIKDILLNCGWTVKKSNQGSIMKWVKENYAGKIDMKTVSRVFKEMTFGE